MLLGRLLYCAVLYRSVLYSTERRCFHSSCFNLPYLVCARVIDSFGLEGTGDYATMLVGNCGYLPNRRLFIMEHVPTLKASKYALISVSKNGFFLVHVQYYTPLSFQMVYPLGCDMQHPCLAIIHNPQSDYSWLRFKVGVLLSGEHHTDWSLAQNLRRISMRPLLLMAFGSEPGHHIFLAKY